MSFICFIFRTLFTGRGGCFCWLFSCLVTCLVYRLVYSFVWIGREKESVIQLAMVEGIYCELTGVRMVMHLHYIPLEFVELYAAVVCDDSFVFVLFACFEVYALCCRFVCLLIHDSASSRCSFSSATGDVAIGANGWDSA